MYGRFFLNVVVIQSTAIFQFLAIKSESLPVGWDLFLVLNFLLYFLDAIAR